MENERKAAVPGTVGAVVGKCAYCGSESHVCHRCAKRVHMDVMRLCDRAERLIIEPDAVDATGIITNHMRVLWGLRDALNEYFANAQGHVRPCSKAKGA